MVVELVKIYNDRACVCTLTGTTIITSNTINSLRKDLALHNCTIETFAKAIIVLANKDTHYAKKSLKYIFFTLKEIQT